LKQTVERFDSCIYHPGICYLNHLLVQAQEIDINLQAVASVQKNVTSEVLT
jgi:hypothetical protein